jgi:hypothetical protein
LPARPSRRQKADLCGVERFCQRVTQRLVFAAFVRIEAARAPIGTILASEPLGIWRI